jgi:hypothetical protein
MGNAEDRLHYVLRLIDAANSEDPTTERADGAAVPKELLYARRMSARLAQFRPGADELLQIAVRAQHLERWVLARTSFPAGRSGYLRWRTQLARHHAERAAALMAAAGYDSGERAAVAGLLRKEGLAGAAAASGVQLLEDVACLVFVEHYLPAFAEQHVADRVQGIVEKTLQKMSPAAREVAAHLIR